MFGASFLNYARVGSRICEQCGQQPSCMNPAVHCERCDTVYCRRCFANSCVFTFGSTVIALPVMLRTRNVCDACAPEDSQEATFTGEYLPFMLRGETFDRAKPNILGGSPTKEMVWLSLDVDKRQLSWKTLELVAQQPKATGVVSLDEIDRIEINTADSATSRNASKPENSSIKFYNARNQLLLWISTSDSRQHSRWNAAMTVCRTVLRYSHQRVFPSAAKVRSNEQARLVDAEKEAEAQRQREQKQQYREQMAKERAAFRESLGTVGMTTTAKIMSSKGSAPETRFSDTDVIDMPASRTAAERAEGDGSVLKGLASQAWSVIGTITSTPPDSIQSTQTERRRSNPAVNSASNRAPVAGAGVSQGGGGQPARLDSLRSGFSRFGTGLSEAAKSVASGIATKSKSALK